MKISSKESKQPRPSTPFVFYSFHGRTPLNGKKPRFARLLRGVVVASPGARCSGASSAWRPASSGKPKRRAMGATSRKRRGEEDHRRPGGEKVVEKDRKKYQKTIGKVEERSIELLEKSRSIAIENKKLGVSWHFADPMIRPLSFFEHGVFGQGGGTTRCDHGRDVCGIFRCHRRTFRQ